jgi:hypothetical protein
MMPWASALTLDEVTLSSKGSTATPLVITSKYTGLMGEPYDIEPNKSLPETDLAERTLAVALAGTQATGSRMVIIGNSKFLTDDIIQQDLGNLALGLGAVSWLAQDESLASIKVKSGQRRAFTFSNPLQQAFVAYGNMLLVILVPILIGLILFLRRRAKSKYTYTDRPVRG